MDASTENDNKKKIKLLLHAEDGFIPYLTPYLLKKYFSPDLPLIKDHLVIGMAVKDTCIAPVFGKRNDSNGDNKDKSQKKKKKQQKKEKKRKMMSMEISENLAGSKEEAMDHSSKRLRHEDGAGTDCSNMKVVPSSATPPLKLGEEENSNNNKKHSKSDANTIKPTGYQFDSQFYEKQLTSLIAPGYNTMTVPTFDLVDDIINFSNRKTNKGGKNNSKYGKKNITTIVEKGVVNKQSDSSDNFPPIASSNNHITLCTPHGMQKLHSETYIKITSALKTDAFVGLFDQAHINDKKKRKVNSIARTKLFTTQIVEENRKRNETKDIKLLWSPLVCSSTSSNQIYNDGGGNGNDSKTNESGSDKYKSITDLNTVLEEIIATQRDSIFGITLVGWHHIQSQKEQMKILQHCVNFLQKSTMTEIASPPPQLECAVLVTNNVKQIMDVTKFGATMFGCDLPTRWARAGKALALSLKQDVVDINMHENENQSSLDENGCIDLSDSRYCRDKLPLLPECECFETYSKSYIHHLIEAKELLAGIILFGHNLRQMLLLCRELSQAKEDGKIKEYCEFIEKQLG